MRIVSSYEELIIRVEMWRDGKKKKEVEDLLEALISAKDFNGEPALSVEEIKAQITANNPANNVEWVLSKMFNQLEVLEKAVDEIDRVVGKERWVQESDIPKLNYVKACAREGNRLYLVAPFNLPHVAMQDMTVAG
ncbi:hypothetical protein FH972_014862 [Carpinus fangiana]|uniref:Uncharacterized protein n=1 Tax=Carpinus fangiana TaxID=176857 RepID=A0A5N6RDP6_9ROSI|nr:hypothetical protein FH972_014862 [Carpinus fangiana]